MSALTISDVIESIKEKFLKYEYELNPELYHEIDVNRVRRDNWQIRRFVLDQEDGNPDKAYEAMIKALQWKKSFGIHDRDDQYFPKEFYELHGIEMYGRDREGRIIHWERTENRMKIPDFMNLEQQFIAHRMEKLDSEGSMNGWTLVTDTLGASMTSVNLDMYKFKIGLLQYYPQGLRSVLIMDLPWILNSLMKIILSFMSPKLRDYVHFIKRDQLTEFVDIDVIPVSLNGKRENRVLPDGLLPLYKSMHLGLTEKQIDEYYEKHRIEKV
jgi:hypothetical protein